MLITRAVLRNAYVFVYLTFGYIYHLDVIVPSAISPSHKLIINYSLAPFDRKTVRLVKTFFCHCKSNETQSKTQHNKRIASHKATRK